MAKRRKLHELTAQNDIRYLGPISYQGFQALGWLCISLSFFILMLRMSARLDPTNADDTQKLIIVLEYFGSLSLPFLLISNFARILSNTEGYKMQLIRTGGSALAIVLTSYILFNRYVVSAIGLFVNDPEDVLPFLTELFRNLMTNGFVDYNIFIDLFLCSLFMLFLTARPKRFFNGKKLLIFRSFAIFPVAWEVASLILKGQASSGRITLPLWTFPLLTVKPPITFAVFMILAFYIKTRELLYCRHGRTHAEYQAFLKTNRNSLHFSVFLSIVMVIAAAVDYLIFRIIVQHLPMTVDAAGNLDLNPLNAAFAMGIGDSIPLLFAVPVIMLFSYTRIPKYKPFSQLIPLIGMAIIVILLIEGIYQVLIGYAQKINPVSLHKLMESIGDSMLPMD